MVKLEDHKVYVDIHKMDMVPYTVAVQAVEQAIEKSQLTQINKAIDTLSKEITSINPDFKSLDD
tara:strand:- start:306 stop:497 length:192 start_codon:yes stop_codon:yes gene_type:complete